MTEHIFVSVPWFYHHISLEQLKNFITGYGNFRIAGEEKIVTYRWAP